MLSEIRQNRPSNSYIFLQLAPRKSKKGIFRNQWRSGGTRSSPTWPYLWSHPVIFSFIFNALKKCLRLDLPAQVCSSGKPCDPRCNISARRWRWQAQVLRHIVRFGPRIQGLLIRGMMPVVSVAGALICWDSGCEAVCWLTATMHHDHLRLHILDIPGKIFQA